MSLTAPLMDIFNDLQYVCNRVGEQFACLPIYTVYPHPVEQAARCTRQWWPGWSAVTVYLVD